MSRGAACGPPFGMGLDVESSGGPGIGFPLCLGSSFGFRVSDWPVGGEYSTHVRIVSRGSCHFLPSGITLTLALSHQRERGQDAPPSPPPGMDSGSAGAAPSGGMGSCLRRNDGGVGGGWGAIKWYCSYADTPPLILREPQHERPLLGMGSRYRWTYS